MIHTKHVNWRSYVLLDIFWDETLRNKDISFLNWFNDFCRDDYELELQSYFAFTNGNKHQKCSAHVIKKKKKKKKNQKIKKKKKKKKSSKHKKMTNGLTRRIKPTTSGLNKSLMFFYFDLQWTWHGCCRLIFFFGYPPSSIARFLKSKVNVINILDYNILKNKVISKSYLTSGVFDHHVTWMYSPIT